MILNNIIPLVNWGMGAAIIGIFVVVCIVLVLVVMSLAKTDKTKSEE